ncbi:DNA cytosine methyltransferase [Candidatus Poriferisocius sp.]|uniref:DNA cytosine methyltransferase n=1 Tax=Candidatus Poriferisocius sp. TaxID=3101276 RepID=UPI003B5C4422
MVNTQRIATFADLFCGIGGFHYAASSLGLACVFACDIDKHAARQYEHNFGVKPAGDITELEVSQIPDHDLLFAGFPCQPFSIIGSRAGMSDSRGTLIYEVIRILHAKQPSAFVLENVRQLVTIEQGATLNKVILELEHAGYVCDWRVLNALDFGLPQRRERVIIVGFKDTLYQDFMWPTGTAAMKSLSEILEADPHPKYFASKRIRDSRHRKHTAEFYPSIWHENKSGNISSHPYSCALRAGASYNYLLVNGERRLTPREQLRLQGFPDSFEIICNDSQVRKQAGNAVPIPMVQAVIRAVKEALN